MSDAPLRAWFQPRNALHALIAMTALVAPALHTVADVWEWYRQGFSTTQLWMTYAAFLPMPWLLLGIYALHEPKPNVAGLLGAILYGSAFIYFAHSALFALIEDVPTYDALWVRLGAAYTLHGVIMIGGGLLFGWSVLRAAWLPKIHAVLFVTGITLNLVLGLLPVPDIFQIFGSTVRNLGLMGMGYALLQKLHRLPSSI